MIEDTYTGKRYSVKTRALQSLGASSESIYRMVSKVLEGRHRGGGILVDVGCGSGTLWRYVRHQFDAYVGLDVIRYEGFPKDAEFYQVNLDTGRAALPDQRADVVASVETIEHLENPRAFMRELVRLTKPGGWVVVTTPNQLSLLSLLTLCFRQRFAAFQDSNYPAHLTALLEVDLQRIAGESGLVDVSLAYSLAGRMALTSKHYPKVLTWLSPRAFSDNLVIVGRRQDV